MTSQNRSYDVKGIANYYGGLFIKQVGDKYYWGIENYKNTQVKEISKQLFDLILLEQVKAEDK